MQNIAVIKSLVCFAMCKNAKCCCHEKVWFVLPCVKMQNVAVMKKIGLFCHF
jgi:hypothetical protein